MNIEILSALFFFAFVMSITPGPNNLYLMASGTAFGWRKTVSYWIGVTIGFLILIIFVIFGLEGVTYYIPFMPLLMKITGVTWMLFLGLKSIKEMIKNTPETNYHSEINTPLSAIDAILLQWLNPKSWTMAIGCTSAYIDISENLFERAIIIGIVFLLIMPPCTAIWMFSGAGIRRFMKTDFTRKIANGLVTLLLLLSAVMILMG